MKKFYLEQLGVHGYSYADERAMHASIMTGSPLLIIGTMGEAKTFAAKSIARLLFGNPVPGEPYPFQKIASDKVNIDDLTGYLNIPALGEGRVEYLESPISIWNKQFVLMDEISRATPKIQNRLLELVYERELQGLPTDEWWVWATMNPLTYAGSQPLDLALAGRFAYVLMPEALVKQDTQRQQRLIEKVIMMQDSTLTPALAYWDGNQDEDRGNQIDPGLREDYERFMIESKNLYKTLWSTWGENVAKYVAAFADTLYNQGKGFAIDTRRCKMFAINIMANIAIQSTHEQRALPIDEVKTLALAVLHRSLPWAATGTKETDLSALTQAHKTAAAFLDRGDSLIYRVVTERDTLAKAILLLQYQEKIDPMHAINLVQSLFDEVKYDENPEIMWKEEATRFAVKLGLTQLFLENEHIWPDTVSLLAREYPIDITNNFGNNLPGIRLLTYKDALEFTKYYDNAYTTKDPRQLAAFYFAIVGTNRSKSSVDYTYTVEQILKRHDLAIKEITRVADALVNYLPLKTYKQTQQSKLFQAAQQAGMNVQANSGHSADQATQQTSIPNLFPDSNEEDTPGVQAVTNAGTASDLAAQIGRTFTVI